MLAQSGPILGAASVGGMGPNPGSPARKEHQRSIG